MEEACSRGKTSQITMGEFFENQIKGSGTYNWAENRSYIW
jgi:hypothetical protein